MAEILVRFDATGGKIRGQIGGGYLRRQFLRRSLAPRSRIARGNNRPADYQEISAARIASVGVAFRDWSSDLVPLWNLSGKHRVSQSESRPQAFRIARASCTEATHAIAPTRFGKLCEFYDAQFRRARDGHFVSSPSGPARQNRHRQQTARSAPSARRR